jgi:hypothetical protein
MKSRWITYRGVEILYCDFSGFGEDIESLRAEVKAVDAVIFRRGKDSVLALADLAGTVTGDAVVELFKNSAASTKGYVRKQAVIGLSGLQKWLARTVALFSGQSMHIFDSAEQAKEWLAAGESLEKP